MQSRDCLLLLPELLNHETISSTVDSPTCAFSDVKFHHYAIFAKKSVPLLIFDTSSTQVSLHRQSLLSTRKTTLSVTFSAHDFYNRRMSNLLATKCLIHLSGKVLVHRSLTKVSHLSLTLSVNLYSAFRLMVPLALAPL